MRRSTMRPCSLLCLLLIVLPANAQRIDLPPTFRELAAKASEKTEIDLDQNTLSFAAKVLSDANPEELAAKQVIANLTGIYVRTYKFDRDGRFDEGDLQAIRTQLSTASSSWARFISTTVAAKPS